MKNLYCLICGKYRKLEKSEISNLLEKILVLSADCKNEDEKIFKEEKSIEIFTIFGLIENI